MASSLMTPSGRALVARPEGTGIPNDWYNQMRQGDQGFGKDRGRFRRRAQAEPEWGRVLGGRRVGRDPSGIHLNHSLQHEASENVLHLIGHGVLSGMAANEVPGPPVGVR